MATGWMNVTSDGSIELRDGRRLGFATYGDPKGTPTVMFTTSLGSRILPDLQRRQLEAAHMWAIVPDRPGVGRSTHAPKRTTVDIADDIAQLADRLSVGPFALWACNHAAKYAFACAHQLRERITAIATVDAAAPMDTDDALESLPERTRPMFTDILRGPTAGADDVAALGRLAQTDPAAAARRFSFPAELDLPGYTHAGMVRWIGEMLPDAARDGLGHALDNWLIMQPWGFALDAITTRALLWASASNDPYPVLAWSQQLAAQLPNATLKGISSDLGWMGWLATGTEVFEELTIASESA